MPCFQKIIDALKSGSQAPLTLARCPDGYEPFVLARLFMETQKSLLYVVKDDARLEDAQRLFAFYAPRIPIVVIPSYDTLPYDRASPNRSLIAHRVEAFLRLAEAKSHKTPVILITSVAALNQKVPPPEFFMGRTLSIKVGEECGFEKIIAFLNTEGYRRSEVVREAGEYAIRGGLLDIFTPNQTTPLRLDFFGDQLQSLKPFDPLTQRSMPESIDAFSIIPSHEIHLNDDSVKRFRSAYRELFGAEATEDLLYTAISERRTYPGFEQWLPLFFEELMGVWDYLDNPLVCFDFQSSEALLRVQEQIEDHYENRSHDLKNHQKNKKGAPARTEGDIYRPLPPEQLYWKSDFLAHLKTRFQTLLLTPFESPELTTAFDLGGGAFEDWTTLRARIRAGNQLAESLFHEVAERLRKDLKTKRGLILVGYHQSSLERLMHMLSEHGAPPIKIGETYGDFVPSTILGTVLPIEHGFETPQFAVVTEQDILGERLIRTRPKKKKAADQMMEDLSSFHAGDLLVHIQHGIGRYEGLRTLQIGASQHDCLELQYDGGDKLFVPVQNIEVLSRFGTDASTAVIDKLGASQWQLRKARVKKRIKEVAEKLMRIAAARALERAAPFEVNPGLFEEFCARFPYEETDDQLRACAEVIEDLARPQPMERLLCGDVGFGKTEIALRAAFIVASQGKQVAIVVPTTLLARQHFKTFKERFEGFGIKVAQLSRLVTSKESKAIKEDIAQGNVGVIIATHAVFSKSLTFKDLNFLVIDEEQHFGVSQKDRLKERYPSLHILTLTATPIPRTLQMALTGVRELSLISTPPVDRLAVKTFVMPFDGLTIRDALQREHYRGGQSFYVAPRIEDLVPLKTQLTQLVPDLKIGLAHGQLSGTELEEIMTAFCDGQFDVLLSTNIVESGLDIPTANTMIIHKADRFGLSQLYQLRGRVGRSKTRGYAYLTYPTGKPLTETATRRLRVLESMDALGVGFTIASHDMDIRGAGNLVGEEQSGHIKEVGLELYQHMLKEAIEGLKSSSPHAYDMLEDTSLQVVYDKSVLIPETYVRDLDLRLSLYRRLSHLQDEDDIASFGQELTDRFGAMPEEVLNLLDVIKLKRLGESAGLEKIEFGPKGILLTFRNNTFKNPAGLVTLLNEGMGTLKLRPDHKLFFTKAWTSTKARLMSFESLLKKLGALAT